MVRRYERGYSFSGFQATSPDKPLPATRLDDELSRVEQATTDLAQAFDEVGALALATSGTSLAVGVGLKTFTVRRGLRYLPGARIRASSAADPTLWMEGVITAYVETSLTVLIDLTHGEGSAADWNINSAGEPAEFQDLFVETKAAAIEDIEAAATAAGAAQVVVVQQAASTAAALGAAPFVAQAQAARDASIVNAQTYATEALGRAAVANGATFDVQGSGNVASYRYRRTDASNSVLIASFPSANAVASNTTEINKLLAYIQPPYYVPPAISTAPVVSGRPLHDGNQIGSAQIGTKLVATPGAYAGADTVSGRWTANGASVASGLEFTPTIAHDGMAIAYVETGANAYGSVEQTVACGTINSAADAYYNSVALLLHCDGADASTTITDNSRRNRTVTCFNGAALSTTWKSKGTASLKFNGVNGSGAVQYASIPWDWNDFRWDLPDGGYTIEVDAFFNSHKEATGGLPVMMGNNLVGAAPQSQWGFGPNAAGKLVFIYRSGTTNYFATSTATVPLSTKTRLTFCYHPAYGLRVGVNGVMEPWVALAATPAYNASLNLILGRNGPTVLDGYIDEIRITKQCRYFNDHAEQTYQAPHIAGDGFAGYDVVLSLGDSNNQGTGAPLDPAIDVSDTRIRLMTLSSINSQNTLKTPVASEPMVQSYYLGAGVTGKIGATLAAARAYIAAGKLAANKKILIVHRGVSATTVATHWKVGGAQFITHRDTIREVNTRLLAPYTWKFVISHLVTNDGLASASAASVAPLYDAMIAEFRTEMGNGNVPWAAFQLAALATSGTSGANVDPPAAGTMRYVLHDAPNRGVANFFLVKADLTNNIQANDALYTVHLSAAAQRNNAVAAIAQMSSLL